MVLNKAPAFIINQFGFTKDNVAERITAPDPNTVVLKIAEPQSPTFLLYCLSANVGGVVDKKTVMAHVAGRRLGQWLAEAEQRRVGRLGAAELAGERVAWRWTPTRTTRARRS